MLEEFIGYAASFIVAISLTMSSILKLRIINLVGAIIFVIYGLLLPAYPVAFVNFLIACINVYYLIQMLAQKEYFRLLKTESTTEYVKHFLNFYNDDINKFFPQFALEENKDYHSFLILRDTVPAGLLILEENKNDLHIILDYVTPPYRDFKTGNFLYQKNHELFTDKRFTSYVHSSLHEKYLLKMGFVKKEDIYILE